MEGAHRGHGCSFVDRQEDVCCACRGCPWLGPWHPFSLSVTLHGTLSVFTRRLGRRERSYLTATRHVHLGCCGPRPLPQLCSVPMLHPLSVREADSTNAILVPPFLWHPVLPAHTLDHVPDQDLPPQRGRGHGQHLHCRPQGLRLEADHTDEGG